MPPANDDFASAQALVGNSGNFDADNTGATRQTPEPIVDDHGNGIETVWFSFTPAANGQLDIWTEDQPGGPGLTDTSMAIYTGAALASLTEVAYNDDTSGPHTSGTYSEIDGLSLVGGVTYHIVVTGFSDGLVGTFRLSWAYTPDLPPPVRTGGKVIRASARLADAYAELDHGSGEDDTWTCQWIGFGAAALAEALSSGSADIVQALRPSGLEAFRLNLEPDGWDVALGNSLTPTPTARVWFYVEIHWVKTSATDATIDVYIDGVHVISSSTSGASADRSARKWRWGQLLGSPIEADLYFFDDVNVGTTRRGGEILAWNGVDLTQFAVTGEVSVVDDPFARPPLFVADFNGPRLGLLAPEDGFEIPFADPTVGPSDAIDALARDPTTGILYGLDEGGNLWTIDTTTALVTLVGAGTPTFARTMDLAFDADGNLYVWGGTGSDGLYSIDKTTGVMTDLGFGNPFGGTKRGGGLVAVGGNLLLLPDGDVHYGGSIYHVDPATGDPGSPVVALSGFNPGTNRYVYAATLAPDDGLIYALLLTEAFETKEFVTINPTTGVVALVADLANLYGGDEDLLYGLEWCPQFVPPPPVRHVIRDTDPPLWRFIVTSKETITLALLDRRTSARQMLHTLNGPAYATGGSPSDDPEINLPWPDLDSPALISHDTRFVYGFRRERALDPDDPPWICRLGTVLQTAQDTGNDAPTTTWTSYDSWQLLMSRPVYDPDTSELPGPEGYTAPAGTLVTDLALQLLVLTEINDGDVYIDHSDLSLLPDGPPLPADMNFQQGVSVGEAWQQICQTGLLDIHLDPMYEPISAPGKIVRLRFHPQSIGTDITPVGTVRYDAVMGWDKVNNALAGIDRMNDGTRLANTLVFWTNDGTPVTVTDPASVAVYGSFWAQQSFPGEGNPTLMDLLALAQLEIRKSGARSITVDPAPERSQLLALRDYGLGDYLPVWASRNLREPIGVDYQNFDPNFPGAAGYLRCYAIPISLDDNGVERSPQLQMTTDSFSG